MPVLKRKYPLGSLAFFGSVTRNDFTAQSDVDVIVDFNNDDFYCLFN